MNCTSRFSFARRVSAHKAGRAVLAIAIAALLLTVNVPVSASGGQANVALSNASASFSQTSNAAWTLKKTGTLDSSTSTITWTITATEGTTVAGHLVADGFVTVTNWGSLGAPIGNIVVNLQTKSGSNWVTESSDIADATHGDAATTAHIDPKASSENKGTFSTNSASGKVEFMDANSNTAFSLKPQVTVAPGATVNLLFSAVFDNTILKLSPGTAVRAEVIVSFGNSTSVPPSAHDVDINGNGQIDSDEVWIRSIPARLGGTVPPQATVNGSPTLSDAASDITATGTATFSNPQFTLGVTAGTVTVNYSGGANGGKITNCAHLTSPGSTTTVGGHTFQDVGGLNVQACDTETIPAGAITAGWNNGDVLTCSQGDWGDPSSAKCGEVLLADFNTVYSSKLSVSVGELSGGFSMTFEGANYAQTYLPADSGPAAALDANLDNPTSSSSGVFGGDVLALQLNVDFSDAGFLLGNSKIPVGNLTLCSFTDLTALNGTTVRQLLGTVNTLLGGGSGAYSISQMDPITADVINSFLAGTPSTWAQQHLFNGACPVWNTGDIVTYTQGDWSAGTAATLVTNNFVTEYGANFVIGLTSNFYAAFDTSQTVLAFFPQSGPAGVFLATVADPTTTSAGAFGGDVAALKLNVDFSDAGIVKGNSGLKFGDLSICGQSIVPALNGTTVRNLLSTANTLISDASSPYSAGDMDSLTGAVNAAFDQGNVNTFAQQHLRNGACP